MLICKGEKAYKCSTISRKSLDDIRKVWFSIIERVSPEDIKKLFEDSTFYFYNEELGVESIETHDTNLVGASITYNADSTCNITIKLTGRSC